MKLLLLIRKWENLKSVKRPNKFTINDLALIPLSFFYLNKQ